MVLKTVNVARDFSRYPAGRYKEDGPYSGATFRDLFLLPVMQAKDQLVVQLDGVRGFGSSFLEEAFGGLVRAGYTPEQVQSSIQLQAEDQSLIEEICDYITNGNDPEEDV